MATGSLTSIRGCAPKQPPIDRREHQLCLVAARALIELGRHYADRFRVIVRTIFENAPAISMTKKNCRDLVIDGGKGGA